MAHDALKHARVRIAEDVISRVLDGEAVILGLEAGVYYGLDSVGTRIWELIGERGWVREILARLVDEYDVEPGRCERDLLGLLRELREQGLITVVDATAQ